MIDKTVYEIEYIRGLQKKYASDPGLIERALYAFGLLEAIKLVGMPFCFKGGTSLMLILDKPARLSTDIDILVEPGTKSQGLFNTPRRIFWISAFMPPDQGGLPRLRASSEAYPEGFPCCPD